MTRNEKYTLNNLLYMAYHWDEEEEVENPTDEELAAKRDYYLKGFVNYLQMLESVSHMTKEESARAMKSYETSLAMNDNCEVR